MRYLGATVAVALKAARAILTVSRICANTPRIIAGMLLGEACSQLTTRQLFADLPYRCSVEGELPIEGAAVRINPKFEQASWRAVKQPQFHLPVTKNLGTASTHKFY